jgi:glycosyltransferase involved in cell wall biosynthesis
LSGGVHVVVVPVFGGAAPPDQFVRRRAASFQVLPLERHSSHPVRDLMARLATPAGRERAQALHPLPQLSSTATSAAAEQLAAAFPRAQAVHVLRLYLAPYLDGFLDSPTKPRLLLDVDDVESDAHHSRGLDEEAERFARLEAYYLPRVDRVVTCTRSDATLLRARHRLHSITAVPNAVRPPSAPRRAATRHDLLFVGSLGYGPNVEAVQWLCREVLPRLRDATTAIVGSRPVPAIRALAADSRITVAADVPSVEPWYASAAVAVVPLRSGGGMQTKVLEAFAHMCPVVSTTIGVLGLEFDDAVAPVLTADSASNFADSCRRLLDDDELATQLAARAERLVRRSYSVDVVAPRIAAIVSDTLAS